MRFTRNILVKKLVYFAFLLLGIITCSCSKNKPVAWKIKVRTTHEIESNNWTIGCEVLDRDYANYHLYKHYLDSLGCKTARIQSGWAKTEQEKGVYKFEWLDSIINDLTSRKIRPWVQLSYGNPIYEGGGGYSLGAGMPRSEAALKAWDNWVRASVMRYKGRVVYWEVWNEGNLKGNNNPSTYAQLYIRTAKIIKEIQPGARISALALAGHGLDFTKGFLHYMDSLDKLDLINEITFHPYTARPEKSYKKAETLKRIIRQYSNNIDLKQGENGAPSTAKTSGALSGHDWNEQRQAKWFLRRMLSDLGHDIPSSVFTIVDFEYPAGQHTVGWNKKGIIAADKKTGNIDKPKPAYRAVQNVAAIFDNQLTRVPDFSYSLDSSKVDKDGKTNGRWLLRPEYSFSIYAYENTTSNKNLVVTWLGGLAADIDTDMLLVAFTFPNVNIDEPWLVDLASGNASPVKKDMLVRNEKGLTIKDVPVSDCPLVIADKSILGIEPKN